MILVFALECVLVGLAGSVLFSATRTRANLPCGIVSMLLAGLSVIAVIVPAVGTRAGTRVSRLRELGVMSEGDVIDHLDGAVAAFAVALLAVFLGDLLAAVLMVRRRVRSRGTAPADWTTARARRMVTWCLVLAATAELVGGRRSLIDSAGVAVRGQLEGRGLVHLLSWLWVIAVIVALEQRNRWPRWRVAAVAGFPLVVLFGAGDRSPFLLLGAYGVVKFTALAARGGVSVGHLLGFCLAVYVAALFIGTVPAWRAQIIGNDYRHQSTLGVLTSNARDPFGSLAEQGSVDTLDGMVLVNSLSPGDRSYSWLRVTDTVTLFVPSQVWAGKPTPVSAEISRRKLGFGASGMFLSGPGYMSVLFRVSAVRALLWTSLGFGIALALARQRITTRGVLRAALLLYFLIRFWSGGDAFDGFHVVGIGLAAEGAAQLARLTLRRTSGNSGVTALASPSRASVAPGIPA